MEQLHRVRVNYIDLVLVRWVLAGEEVVALRRHWVGAALGAPQDSRGLVPHRFLTLFDPGHSVASDPAVASFPGDELPYLRRPFKFLLAKMSTKWVSGR